MTSYLKSTLLALTLATIAVSRLAAMPGDAHRFAAVNPVFILWSERA